jgi:hypothetical protein
MRDLYWLTSTSSAVLYALLLAVMLAITVVRAGGLSWRLFGGVARRRMPLERVLDGSISADDLARAALANLVSPEQSEERLAQLRTGPRAELDAALRTLRAADARFDYLWRRMAIRVSSTWSLMRLTVLVAAFFTAYGFFPTWQYFMLGDRTSTTIGGVPTYMVDTLYEAGEWTLARLALGLAVAGGLSVVSMVFDGLLQRRLASWKYLYATVRDALSGGQPLE